MAWRLPNSDLPNIIRAIFPAEHIIEEASAERREAEIEVETNLRIPK